MKSTLSIFVIQQTIGVLLALLILHLPTSPLCYAWKELFPQVIGFSRHSRRFRHPSPKIGLRGGDDKSHEDDDRLVKLTPRVEEPPMWAPGNKKRALILMDVFSEYHGLFLGYRARTVYGVATIPVFSDYMKGYFQATIPPGDELDDLLSISMPMTSEETETWCSKLDMELVGLHCESDSGLEASERFSNLLGSNRLLHFNKDGVNPARRHKYLMNQAVSQAGLPSVRQRLCDTLDEALSFAKQEFGTNDDEVASNNIASDAKSRDFGPKVVVKPIRGVASDDVYLCDTLDSVEQAFNKIYGSTIFGSPREKHDKVLVQEYAVGQEYAIDIVSKNGEHKVAAIWKYDKRPANGASFVYYATHLYDGDDAAMICEYAKRCLDSLGVEWGLSHTEVIIGYDSASNERLPRLVEVNCRQHNMDFIPLVMACVGYNAFDMLLAAHLGGLSSGSDFPPDSEGDRLEWDLLPELPAKLTRKGAMIHLVNYERGVLSEVNRGALMEIHSLESVVDMEVYESFLQIGDEITPTTDIRSDAGWVQLVNDDHETFQRDYDRIVELMPSLFKVEEKSQN